MFDKERETGFVFLFFNITSFKKSRVREVVFPLYVIFANTYEIEETLEVKQIGTK